MKKAQLCIGLLSWLLSTAPVLAQGVAAAETGPHFASGIKVGEVRQDSAIVWVRTTKHPLADFSRLAIFTEGLKGGVKDAGQMPIDVVPGQAAEVRVRYWPAATPEQSKQTAWAATSAAANFVHQFQLNDLQSACQYRWQAETRRPGGTEVSATMDGGFQTAPRPDQQTPVRFIVTTCQAVRSIDSGADGHQAYANMLKLQPSFFVHTGDIVYYDKAPLCRNRAQAEAK